MKLDQLFVQNFKGFEQKILPFSPQFNVLSGDNATGKTAILDAIAIGIGALFLGFDSISSRPIRKSEMRHIGYLLGAELKLEPSPFIIQSLREGELIDLNESEPAEYEVQSIENIAEYKMGVKIPQ